MGEGETREVKWVREQPSVQAGSVSSLVLQLVHGNGLAVLAPS